MNVKKVNEKDWSDLFLLLNAGVIRSEKECCICLSCHKSLKKNNIPCQSIANNLFLAEIPIEISALSIWEKELICQRLLFKKAVIMSKVEFPKLKAETENVPMDVKKAVKTLPCTGGLMLLKLKKKLPFKCHLYFEPVARTKLLNALTNLNANNPLYHDINIIPN